MRVYARIILLLIPLPSLFLGQSWEVGGSAGYGTYHNVTVTNGTSAGSAGFAAGPAFGAVLGNQIHHWIGGEVRYTFRYDDLQVSSGSTKVRAPAQSHAIHYDVLVHVTSIESRIRPFLAAGAGVKVYRGTGPEPVFQPLSNLVVLSHTNEAQPLISIGGGVKFLISRHALLRVDFRDYATPVPTSLLAAPPSSRISGWIHDLVPMVGISTTF